MFNSIQINTALNRIQHYVIKQPALAYVDVVVSGSEEETPGLKSLCGSVILHFKNMTQP